MLKPKANGPKDSPDVTVPHTSIEGDTLTFTAYRLNSAPALQLVPATRSRAWMDATRDRFAYRCLPLLIANQAGWFLLNSHTLRATWDGGEETSAVQITYLSGSPPYPALSHFGHGVLTWHVPYLFRTPPGYTLLARGPTNWPKDGATALDGIIETDWAVATFTMNWKLTAVDRAVTFEEGEPICMLAPQRRGELEAFRAEVRDLRNDAELGQAHHKWTDARARFLADLRVPGSEAAKQEWQRHYFRGTAPDGSVAPTHQTKLVLREFEDLDGICAPDEPENRITVEVPV